MTEPKAPPGYTLTDAGLCMPTDLRADALSDLRHPTAWLQDWSLGGRAVHSGVAVSPQGSMALSAYYACLNVIAQDCAKLPLPVLRELKRGREKVREHPLWTILQRRFNSDMTAYTGRWVMTHHAVGWGNGYGLILRDRSMTRTDGQVTGLYPLHPSRVRPQRDQDTGKLLYHVRRGNSWLEFQETPLVVPDEDMLHLKGPSHDGIVGYSVCEMAAESLGLSLAAQEYGASFFGNSATPSGVLRHPAKLSPEAQAHLKESWNERHGGPGRSQGTAILEEGMEWVPITIPPEQAQFLQTRQFQIPEIARWFRMSLHKIADLTNAHHTNIEQQNVEHVTDTMMPWYVGWEQEIARKLLPDADLYVKHDTRALLRGDSAARAAYYQAMTQIGAYCPNDVLELEEMNPFEGGDEHFLQIQYAPIRKIIDGTARQARAAGRPGTAADPALAETAPRNGYHPTATYMGS